MSADQTYRVGVIGCGRKGHGHARGYVGNPRTEIVAAADPDPANLEIFLERFAVRGYADYQQMLAAEPLDIVAPILPVQPNPQVVVDCAKAGVGAIYCEKPMAVSLAESDEMVAACQTRGIPLAAGDAYRNMPHHWRVKALIDAGELGDVHTINLYQGTGEISGGGCQGLSVMRLFADDADVEWLTGWCSDDPASDYDQGMGGHVRFTNGIDAFISNQRSILEGIEVVCAKGVYHTNWGAGHLWRGEPGGELTRDDDVFAELGTSGWMEPSGSRQRGGIESIVEALDSGREPRCSGDNMRKVLEIAVGLRESHRRGFTPIQFPIEDRSLGIVPSPSRLLNKKQVLGEERYAEQIQSAASQPIGGAQVSNP
jgi:predicted dehydrogenase